MASYSPSKDISRSSASHDSPNMADVVIKELLTPEKPEVVSLFSPPPVGSPETAKDLSRLLLAGNRADAVKAAMSGNLWAHALIIASFVSKDVYNDVITSYAQAHVGSGDPVRTLLDLFGGKAANPGMLRSFLTECRSLMSLCQLFSTQIAQRYTRIGSKT